jgi:hypothetical protein
MPAIHYDMPAGKPRQSRGLGRRGPPDRVDLRRDHPENEIRYEEEKRKKKQAKNFLNFELS